VFSGGNAAAWRRVVVAGLAGAVVGLAGAVPAMADEPVTAKPRGGDAYGYVRLEGFDKPVDVGPLSLDFNGERAEAYCIDLHHPVALNTDYKEGSWSEAEVKNLGKVQWVLLHGYPQGDPAALLPAAGADASGISTDRLKQLLYVGTQVSVWHFSDGAVLTGPGERRGRGGFRDGEFAVVQKVYEYLTSKATTEPEPKAELTIDPSASTAAVGDKAGPFTVTGPSGDIALTVTGGTAVDAADKAVATVTNGSTFWLKRNGAGDVTALAKAQSTHSAGRVFLFPGTEKRQKLILAGTVGDELAAGVKADFTKKPESAPSPSASASGPAPAPSTSTSAAPSVSPSTPAGGEGGGDGGGTLPKTGASTMLVVGAGLLLLIAGAVAVVIVRRRKVSFTA
jgi:LPXTG-motif cell wall-anchored protein/TQXA domain-containing protein